MVSKTADQKGDGTGKRVSVRLSLALVGYWDVGDQADRVK